MSVASMAGFPKPARRRRDRHAVSRSNMRIANLDCWTPWDRNGPQVLKRTDTSSVAIAHVGTLTRAAAHSLSAFTVKRARPAVTGDESAAESPAVGPIRA